MARTKSGNHNNVSALAKKTKADGKKVAGKKAAEVKKSNDKPGAKSSSSTAVAKKKEDLKNRGEAVAGKKKVTKPGKAAIRDIKKYQKSNDLLLRK